MSAWLSGLPLIGYGMAATFLLRRHGRGVFALALTTGGLVAVAVLAALMTTLSTGPTVPGAAEWASPSGATVAVAASSVGAAGAVVSTGSAMTASGTGCYRLTGPALLVVALSEGLAIYGLVVAGVLFGAG